MRCTGFAIVDIVFSVVLSILLRLWLDGLKNLERPRVQNRKSRRNTHVRKIGMRKDVWLAGVNVRSAEDVNEMSLLKNGGNWPRRQPDQDTEGRSQQQPKRPIDRRAHA